MNGYERTRALQRTLRRQRIRSVLLWAAVALFVFGFTFAVNYPWIGWPLLGLAVLSALGGKQ